jgi:hypothetical protein
MRRHHASLWIFQKQNNQSLRPVNIAQIYMAEQSHQSDAEYILDGQPVTMVSSGISEIGGIFDTRDLDHSSRSSHELAAPNHIRCVQDR